MATRSGWRYGSVTGTPRRRRTAHRAQRGRLIPRHGTIGNDATAPWPIDCAVNDEHTTAVVQRYLDELGGDSPVEPIVRALLDRSVRRLHLLCASLLHRSYPRLTR